VYIAEQEIEICCVTCYSLLCNYEEHYIASQLDDVVDVQLTLDLVETRK